MSVPGGYDPTARMLPEGPPIPIERVMGGGLFEEEEDDMMGGAGESFKQEDFVDILKRIYDLSGQIAGEIFILPTSEKGSVARAFETASRGLRATGRGTRKLLGATASGLGRGLGTLKNRFSRKRAAGPAAGPVPAPAPAELQQPAAGPVPAPAPAELQQPAAGPAAAAPAAAAPAAAAAAAAPAAAAAAPAAAAAAPAAELQQSPRTRRNGTKPRKDSAAATTPLQVNRKSRINTPTRAQQLGLTSRAPRPTRGGTRKNRKSRKGKASRKNARK